jgi:hypothetical protein
VVARLKHAIFEGVSYIDSGIEGPVQSVVGHDISVNPVTAAAGECDAVATAGAAVIVGRLVGTPNASWNPRDTSVFGRITSQPAPRENCSLP